MSFEKKKTGAGGKYSTSNGENSPQNKRWLIGIYNLKTEMYKRKREREKGEAFIVAFCRKKGSGVLYNVGETKESAGFVQTKVVFCRKKVVKKNESEFLHKPKKALDL
jgi:hypothetical protein